MGLRALLAPLPLLLLLSRGLSSQGTEGGDQRVRLCGRELVRAIIFTCGASRWKRIFPTEAKPPAEQEPQDQAPQADFVQITSNKEQGNKNLLSVLDPTVEQLRSLSQPADQQSLKDLFSLYDNHIESVPLSDNFIEYLHQAEDAACKRGGETVPISSKSLNNFPWVKYPRRKRDISVSLAKICCELGCTQSDFSKLC